MKSMIKPIFILIFLIFSISFAYSGTFVSCLFNVEIISSSKDLKGSGAGLNLLTKFRPSKEIKNDKSCQSYLGKSLEKPLVFKSKQYIPFIKKGNLVTLDYSHFIVDENDDSLNLEVWKVVNIKTQRSDHD